MRPVAVALTLKASAVNGASGSAATSPRTGGMSEGAGRYATTASSSGSMPRSRYAEPHRTTTASPERVRSRSASVSVPADSAPSAQNSSRAPGCSSATVSSRCRLRRRASSRSSSGTGRSVYAPVPSGHTYARIRTRSTTPVKPSSRPMGSWTGSGTAPRRVRIDSTAASSSAPARSILLTNARRGTPCRSACRHTVSLCGSTPATASKTATAPSRTRSERSTSSEKSTWPGVSIRLIRCPSQSQLTAAAKIVMPRSRSCGSKSVTVVPSWTSPRLWVAPVRNRNRSVTVVLPASTWARMPRLRTRSVRWVRTVSCLSLLRGEQGSAIPVRRSGQEPTSSRAAMAGAQPPPLGGGGEDHVVPGTGGGHGDGGTAAAHGLLPSDGRSERTDARAYGRTARRRTHRCAETRV